MSDTDPTNEDSEFAAKAREAMEARAQLERDNALLRAGLDPDSDKAKLVSRLVEGEFTPESIRQAQDTLAKEFGAPTTPAVETIDPSPPVDDPRRQAAQQMRDVTGSTGERIPEPPPADPTEEGYKRFAEARRRGTPVEDAAAHVFSGIFTDVAEQGSQSRHVWEGWDRHAEKAQR